MLQDIGIGMLTTAMLCSLWGQTPTWWHFLWGVLFALAPDIDTIPEWVTKRKIASHAGNPRDHRTLLHYPLVFVPVGTVVVYMFGGGLLGVLFLVNCTLHFIHDSMGLGWGVRWAFPFNRNSYKLFCSKVNRPSSFVTLTHWTPEELPQYIKMYGDPDWLCKHLRSHSFVLECIVLVVGIGTMIGALT